MKIRLFLGLALMSCVLSGCIIDLDDDDFGCERGGGATVLEEFLVDDFDGVDLQIGATTYLRQGPAARVRVEGYANLVDRLDLRVRNGVLEIDFDGCVRNLDDFSVFITVPDLEYLRLSASGTIFSENTLLLDDLDLELLGSGHVDLLLEAEELDVELSGSGDIRLDGIADELDLELAGSGDVRAYALDLLEADLQISGSGNTEVFVREFLRIRLFGSGDVRFRGNPDLDVEIFGSGRVIDAN